MQSIVDLFPQISMLYTNSLNVNTHEDHSSRGFLVRFFIFIFKFIYILRSRMILVDFHSILKPKIQKLKTSKWLCLFVCRTKDGENKNNLNHEMTCKFQYDITCKLNGFKFPLLRKGWDSRRTRKGRVPDFPCSFPSYRCARLSPCRNR